MAELDKIQATDELVDKKQQDAKAVYDNAASAQSGNEEWLQQMQAKLNAVPSRKKEEAPASDNSAWLEQQNAKLRDITSEELNRGKAPAVTGTVKTDTTTPKDVPVQPKNAPTPSGNPNVYAGVNEEDFKSAIASAEASWKEESKKEAEALREHYKKHYDASDAHRWRDEHGAYTQYTKGDTLYRDYDDGHKWVIDTSDGKWQYLRHTFPNGDIDEYHPGETTESEFMGEIQVAPTRHEAPHIPKVGFHGGKSSVNHIISDTLNIGGWDAVKFWQGMSLEERDAIEAALKGNFNLDNSYIKEYAEMPEQALQNELDRQEQRFRSATNDVDKYDASRRVSVAIRELQPKMLGFDNLSDAKSDPGMYDMLRYNRKNLFGSNDVYDYYVNNNIPNSEVLKDYGFDVENRIEKAINQLYADRAAKIYLPIANYVNMVYGDEEDIKRYKKQVAARAGYTHVPMNDLMENDYEDWAQRIEERVDAHIKKDLDDHIAWMKDEHPVLSYMWLGSRNSLWGKFWEAALYSADEVEQADKIEQNYGMGFWGELGKSGISLAMDLPIIIATSGGASYAVGGAEALTESFAARMAQQAITMSAISLLGQTATDLQHKQFSGADAYLTASVHGAVSGLMLGAGGELTSAITLAPKSLMRIAANKVIGNVIETAAFSIPQWVEAAYKGELAPEVGENGEVEQSSWGKMVRIAAANAFIVAGMKLPKAGKGWKTGIKDGDYAQLREAGYGELADAIKNDQFSYYDKETGQIKLFEGVEQQLGELMMDMGGNGKGISWDAFRRVMRQTGRDIIPPAYSKANMKKNAEGKYVITLTDSSGKVITEKVYEKGEKAKAEKDMQDLEKQSALAEEMKSITTYETKRESLIMNEALSRVAENLNEGRDGWMRDENGNYILDENGNRVEDPNYVGHTPETAAGILNRIIETPKEQRTPEDSQLLDMYRSQVRALGEGSKDADAMMKMICERYGVTEEEVGEVAKLSPKERKSKSPAAKAYAAYLETMRRGPVNTERPVGTIELNGETVEVFNTPDIGDKMDFFVTKDENGKVQMVSTKEAKGFTPYSNEREQNFERSRNKLQEQVTAFEDTLRDSYNGLSDEGLESEIKELEMMTAENADDALLMQLDVAKRVRQEREAAKAEVEAEAKDEPLPKEGEAPSEKADVPEEVTEEPTIETEPVIDNETPSVEETVETPTAEVETSKTDTAADDAMWRKKAEAFVEAYFGDKTPEEKAGLVDFYSQQRDFENTVNYDKQDNPNDARVAAYENAVKSMEAEQPAPAEDVAKPSQPTETPQPVNDMQPAKVETGHNKDFVSYLEKMGTISIYKGADQTQVIGLDNPVGAKALAKNMLVMFKAAKDRGDLRDRMRARNWHPTVDNLTDIYTWFDTYKRGEIGDKEVEALFDTAARTEYLKDISDNEIKPAEVPEAEVKDAAPTPEPAKDRIDELLDAMGFDKKEERDEQRAFYEDKNNAEQFEKDYKDFVSKEVPQPKEEVKVEEKKDDVVDDSQQEPEIVDDLDAPMPMKKTKKGREIPDFDNATVEQTYNYLYGEGSDRNRSDGLVENTIKSRKDRVEEAQKALDKAKAKEQKLRETATVDDMEALDDAEAATKKANEALKAAQADLEKWEDVQRLASEGKEGRVESEENTKPEAPAVEENGELKDREEALPDTEQQQNEKTAAELEKEFNDSTDEMSRVEQEWDDKIKDYVAEKYPTQATVTAETNSPIGKAERAAMNADPEYKRLLEEQKRALDEAKKKNDEAYNAWQEALKKENKAGETPVAEEKALQEEYKSRLKEVKDSIDEDGTAWLTDYDNETSDLKEPELAASEGLKEEYGEEITEKPYYNDLLREATEALRRKKEIMEKSYGAEDKLRDVLSQHFKGVDVPENALDMPHEEAAKLYDYLDDYIGNREKIDALLEENGISINDFLTLGEKPKGRSLGNGGASYDGSLTNAVYDLGNELKKMGNVYSGKNGERRKEIVKEVNDIVGKMSDEELDEMISDISFSKLPDDVSSAAVAHSAYRKSIASQTETGVKPGKAKKFTAKEVASKDVLRPPMMGVFHDPQGFGVVTDAHVLVADKKLYDKENKGKIIAEHPIKEVKEEKRRDGTVKPGTKGVAVGGELPGKFPDWRKVVPKKEDTTGVAVDFGSLANDLSGLQKHLKEEWEQQRAANPNMKESFAKWSENATVLIKFPDGTIHAFNMSTLDKFVRASAGVGAKELRYYEGEDGRAISAEGKDGVALCMPVMLNRYALDGVPMGAIDLVKGPTDAAMISSGKGASFQKGDVAKPAKAETKQARAFTARTIKKLRKAGVKVKLATQAEAQRVRELAEKVGAQFQAVWHGSGNKFDEFDHSHMGEGEGAQAYGWGTYVTQVEGIAGSYAKSSAAKNAVVKFRGADTAAAIERMFPDQNPDSKPISREIINIISDLKIGYSFDNAKDYAVKTRRDWLGRHQNALDEYKKGLEAKEKVIERIENMSDEDYANTNFWDEANIAAYDNNYKENAAFFAWKRAAAIRAGNHRGRELTKEELLTELRKNLRDEKTYTLKDYEAAVKDAKDAYDFVNGLTEEDFETPRGGRYLYEVEIPDNDGKNYLPYNRPVGDEMLVSIGKELEAQGWEKQERDTFEFDRYKKDGVTITLNPKATGADVYEELSHVFGSMMSDVDPSRARRGAPSVASEFLNKCGIVGIEYPAQYRSGGRGDGSKNYVIFNEADAKIINRTEFLTTSDGTIYGWHDENGIHLTEDGFNPDTPVHEYTHGFMEMIRRTNPEKYKRIVSGLRESEVWEEVLNDPEYQDIKGDEIKVASEVASRVTGRENSSRVNSEFDFSEGIFTKANAIAAKEKVKNALKDLWDTVAEWFGAKLDKAMPYDRFARMTIKELNKGVNPDAIVEEAVRPIEGLLRGDSQITKQERIQVRNALESAEATPATINSIVARDDMSARNVAMEWVSKNIPEPITVSTEIGDLIINKKSISDSLAHGFSQAKLDAIPTLLPAFENKRAVYIGSGEDVNGNPITDHYFAYPIDYNGERDYVFCRTREDQNTHRLYIHEVITKEDIINGQTLQSTALEKPRTGLPLYRKIMSFIFGDKVKPEFSVVQGNGENSSQNIRDYAAEMRELMRRRLRGEDVTAELEQLRADRRAAEAARSGENPPATSTGGVGNSEPPIKSPTPPAPATPEPAPELPPTGYERPMSPIEMAQEAAIKAVADTKASLEQRNAARRELTASLRNIHKAMGLQKEYDRATVENVVNLCKMMVQSGLIDHSYVSNLTPLFTKIKGATGKQDLTSTVNDIMDVMLKSQERSVRNEIAKLLNTKGTKVDQNGVVTQAGLDIRGQHTMKELSEYMGKGSVIIDNHIAKLEEERAKIPDGHQERIDDIDDKILGSQLAKQFSQIEETHSVNIREAEEDLNFLKERYKAGEIGIKEYTEQKHALENLIRSYRMAQADALWNQANALRYVIAGGKEGTRNWIEQQKERKNEIRHNAYSDMEGTSKRTQGDPTAMQKIMNSAIPKFFSSSLYTLQTMLKSLGNKHAMGEGYLYNRFFRGWMEQRDAEITEYRDDMKTLNSKAKELTGHSYFGIYNMIQKLPKMTVEYMDGGEMVPHELDQGQLGYAYMVNKMEDGAAALRNMGITEEKMQEISNFLDPKLKEFYDWLQDDFLAGKWDGMNEVHRRMFGADMDRVANYIPLRRDREAGTQEVDISQENEQPLQSTVVGSIIQRVHSNLGIDLKHNNAIDVVANHLLEATHWKHFSEWKRDANTLLSDTTFRNKVKNSTTIYGSGDVLWNRLNQVFQIAGGDYKPKAHSAGVDKAIVDMARTVNTAKVSLRVFTAAKQLLSLPVFATECNTATLLKNLGFLLSPVTSKNAAQNSFLWCLQNLPQFRERWVSRTAGETRLENGDLGWGYSRQKVLEAAGRIGLTPNAFIDVCTVAAGAKSVYEKRYAQYKKDGYSEEAAAKKAKIDAETAFNESQQSSEKTFVSPIQVDRTAVALGLSTFRNASMGFERKFIDAIRNFRHLTDHKDTVEFMKKQMERDGLTETQAKSAAERLYRRALWRSTLNFLMFGFGAQMAWNVGGKLPYLIFGDNDEEKKKMVEQAAIHAGVGGWIEGLPAGDMLSEGMTNWAMNLIESGNPLEGNSFFEFDPDLLTVTSDFVKMTKAIEGKNPLKGATDFLNLLGQIYTGVNPQTLTDAGVAIYDACDGKPEVGNEALMCILRIMQCPQSQLDQMYIDELKMSAREAQKLTPEEVARRYAYYKAHKDTPYMWWMYNQNKKDEIVKKYEGDFYKKLNTDVKEEGGTAEDYHDLMESATTKKKHDEYKKKEIDALAAQGPEALMKAWDKEHAKGASADYKYMRTLMSRYQKEVYGEEKMPADSDAAYEAAHGEDLDKQAEKIGRDFGFEAQDSYYQMSQTKTKNSSANNKTIKEFQELGGSFRYTENGEFLDMDEYNIKLPVEDKAKRAKALAFVEEHKPELQRIYRNGWRMKRIASLYKELDSLEAKRRLSSMLQPTSTMPFVGSDKIYEYHKEISRLLDDEAGDRDKDNKSKKK